MTSKNSRMTSLLQCRLKIHMKDSRQFIGQMVAFDKHMNLVLAECEEFRFIKKKKKNGHGPNKSTLDEADVQVKRTLGLAIIRGEFIVSMSVEGPPAQDVNSRVSVLKSGPGFGRPLTDNISRQNGSQAGHAPIGLSGPVMGMSGPSMIPIYGMNNPFPVPPSGFRPPNA